MPIPIAILSAFTGVLIAVGAIAQRWGADSRPDFSETAARRLCHDGGRFHAGKQREPRIRVWVSE